MPLKKYRTLFTLLIFAFINAKSWSQTNIPPKINAVGNQIYCPLSEQAIVTSFDIVDPDNSEIAAFFIQISTGYAKGEDRLILIGSHPNITATWSELEGKLTLKGIASAPVSYVNLIAAVKAIVFKSNSTAVSGEKTFSFTIGDANYLPSTNHYYEYVPAEGIIWTDAKIAAEGRNYFGLKGYLATITSPEEAKLSGEQAAGAGWIGGSDAETEGLWKWVTGPETGKTFWFGNFTGTTNGTDIPFAFWNTNEPNQAGNEDYAHVTAPGVGIPGSWNDLKIDGDPPGPYHPKGYIVEYGGTPGDPIVDISASTKISVSSISSTTPNSNCGPGNVLLSATATLGGTILWFDALTGGTQIGSGHNFLTPSIATNTTFYAVASFDGICNTGIRTPVIASIFKIPTIISTTGATICGAGIGTLLASASAGIVNWYDVPTGGTALATGTSFNSPIVATNTTYYVDATDNGCTTATRTPITITVQYTPAPTGAATHHFCDIENATIANLNVVGTAILWYANPSGGNPLNSNTILLNHTNYYASQTVNTCESAERFAVAITIYETVIPALALNIPVLKVCDNNLDGADTNGFTIFDLTLNEPILLNGKSNLDFNINYFTDANYATSSQIMNPNAFVNTTINNQIIYTRIVNKLDNTCFTDNSFAIQVNALPIIKPSLVFKNCDEDGTPDGFTNFNLNEANAVITNGNADLTLSFYLSIADANAQLNAVNPSPFNNAISNIVYARAENSSGCYRLSTVNLEVSVTSFQAGFNFELKNCALEHTDDNFSVFDLREATNYFLTQLPPQHLSIHYFKTLNDAQLEQNEILPQQSYQNEVPFSQTLYVRVENIDNGDCFGIGPNLLLTVNPIPQFDLEPNSFVCLNDFSISISAQNPKADYNYIWFDSNNNIIGNNLSLQLLKGGDFSVTATNTFGCSTTKSINVKESVTATIETIDIVDDAENNTIKVTISGNGLYEIALDNLNSSVPFLGNTYVYSHVKGGIHTVYIRDKNGCGTTSQQIAVIEFPKFLTPNGDGLNDTWNVTGASLQPNSLIYIYDRFSRLLAKINPSGAGWDGTFNGRELPSNDYWFTAQLTDGHFRKGHFSLIRR
ncbi:MAG: hypothetical protein COX71_00550 [Flavobacteriales bacterium CG_4_10_14_0_2_um_filter_35_18]|nr:MAG: hypothetical protein COX71_00550 [Flavobacteriales bacterium CG_4_10_14_0_2_um_filter_35_18]